jgi:hypothetical protein
MKHRDILIALAIVLAVFALSLYRYASPSPTTQAGAIAALKQAEEWVKWVSQVQLAALGVLIYIILEKESLRMRALSRFIQTVAVTGLISLASSIFLSSWLLSSLISNAIRIHATSNDSVPSAKYDVYEQPAFGWLDWPTLGNFLSSVHWLWACGLVALATTIVGLLLKRSDEHTLADAQTDSQQDPAR